MSVLSNNVLKKADLQLTESRNNPQRSVTDYERLTRLRDYLEAKMVIVDILLAINLLVEGVVDDRGRALVQPAIAALANLLANPGNPKSFRMDGAATLTLEALPNTEERKQTAEILHEIHAAFAVGKGDYLILKTGTDHLTRIIRGLDEQAKVN